MTGTRSPWAGLRALTARLIGDGQGAGPGAILAAALASVTPLLVVSGLATSAYATTMVLNLTVAFLGVAVVLFLLVPGYVAMSQRTRIGGAIHAYVTLGLGPAAGVAALFVALFAYFFLQGALYLLIGPEAAAWAAAHLPSSMHWSWLVWSLTFWAVISPLAMVKLKHAVLVLAPLTFAEIVISLLISANGLAHPAAGQGAHPLVHSLFAGQFGWAGVGGGVGFAIAILGFEGWETTAAYVREARKPRRTVTIATYACLIVAVVVYVVSLWSMQAHYGRQVVAVAQQEGPGEFFTMVTGWPGNLGAGLLVSSAAIGALAFLGTQARYLLVAARVNVLPKALGKVGPSGVPRRAALVQISGSLVLILFTAWKKIPPLQVFYIGGVVGGVSMLLILTLTAVGIVAHFRKAEHDESVWTATILPGAAALLLAGMDVLAVRNFPSLIGIASNDPTVLRFAIAGVVVIVAGVGRGMYLKTVRPERYRMLSEAFAAPVTAAGDPVVEVAL